MNNYKNKFLSSTKFFIENIPTTKLKRKKKIRNHQPKHERNSLGSVFINKKNRVKTFSRLIKITINSNQRHAWPIYIF